MCDSLKPAETRVLASVQNYYAETASAYARYWCAEYPALHLGICTAGEYRHADALARTNEYLAAVAKLETGATVLDAGCGLGGSIHWLARQRGCSVVGLNVDLMQLAAAITCNGHQHSDRILVCGDFHRMPVHSSSVDVVWAIESAGHAYDRSGFWMEARRVMKPTGVIAVAEAFLSSPEVDPERPDLSELVDGWKLFSLVSWDQNVALLAAAGLRIAAMHDVTELVLPSAIMLSGICRSALDRSRRDGSIQVLTAVQIGNMMAGQRLADLFRDGVLRYVLYAATNCEARRFDVDVDLDAQ